MCCVHDGHGLLLFDGLAVVQPASWVHNPPLTILASRFGGHSWRLAVSGCEGGTERKGEETRGNIAGAAGRCFCLPSCVAYLHRRCVSMVRLRWVRQQCLPALWLAVIKCT